MTSQTERIDRFDVLYDIVERMPSPERATRMVELYLRYARSWVDGDFDGLLGCLVEAPVFEQYPQRLRFAGRDAVRARAERLQPIVAQLDPRTNGDTVETRAIAFGEDALIHEVSGVFQLVDGTRRRCHLVTVIVFRGDRIVAERTYTDHYLEDLVNEALEAGITGREGVSEVGDDGCLAPEVSDADSPGVGSALDCPALEEAARQLPARERVSQMVDINLEYMQHYFDGNFGPMLDCLVDSPAFEQFPAGIRMEGREAAYARNSRDHAEHMKQMDPRQWKVDLHRITTSGAAADLMAHEFSNVFDLPDGSRKRCYMLAVIPYAGDKIVGERVYGDGARGRKTQPNLEATPGFTLL